MIRREFYENLSEEVKEKIKACESEEEMMNVLEEEKIEISPDMLDTARKGPSMYCTKECDDDFCAAFCYCN